jgi:CDP-paratose 2-epimerase
MKMVGQAAHCPAALTRRPILVTGGAGFIGCNLADRLAGEGEDVMVFDALARPGVENNLGWLQRRHPKRVTAIVGDVRDAVAVTSAMREASAVFHFAAQVAVTTSIVDPELDFEVNLRGTLVLLEALRRRRDRVPLVFASTNKVYGDLSEIELDGTEKAYLARDRTIRRHGISEDHVLSFHAPYGCSKGAADQYVLDYARSFGLPTAVMRMSCIYGPRQLGTEDQGWVAHFLLRALAGEPINIFGDGRQVRDILYVADAVDAYVRAWRAIEAIRGRVFNIGGGPVNAVSLLQVVSFIERLLGKRVETRFIDWRASDQRYYVSDIRRARRELRLPRPTPWRTGVAALADWLQREGRSASGLVKGSGRSVCLAEIAS